MSAFKYCLLLTALSLWVARPEVVAAEDLIGEAIASERMPTDRVQDSWRKPDEILRFLEIAPGHHALDFYAGPGYYSELLAHIVGPAGRVLIYNNELYNQAAHNGLTARLARNRLPNAARINAPSNYLKLEPGSLDRVLIVLTYHDIYWQPGGSPETMGDPNKILRILHAALKPGGLVVVVDHVASPTTPQDITPVANRLHRIDPQVVRADFARAGFEFAGESDVLRRSGDDHIKSVFDASVRHNTDQFVYKFRRP